MHPPTPAAVAAEPSKKRAIETPPPIAPGDTYYLYVSGGAQEPILRIDVQKDFDAASDSCVDDHNVNIVLGVTRASNRAEAKLRLCIPSYPLLAVFDLL